jgi:NADPH-dependent glutamate synthase beta subunit-like oxidoreductase
VTEKSFPATIPDAQYYRKTVKCQEACPVYTDARGYVTAVARGELELGFEIAHDPNPLSTVCGRICGAPCEAACRRGKVPRVDDDGTFVANDRPISIRALKRFVCSLAGPEARPPTAVLDEVRRYVPTACCDADEMAALLRGALDGRIPRASGQKVAIIGAGPAGL